MAAVETKKDEVVDRFETYEDYLDTFITEDDMIFLGEEEISRVLVELGYRSSATLTRAVETSYWSRSTETLCSGWLKIEIMVFLSYALKTQLKAPQAP